MDSIRGQPHFLLLEKGLKRKVEVEVKTTFHKDTLDSLHVLGKIPGGMVRGVYLQHTPFPDPQPLERPPARK